MRSTRRDIEKNQPVETTRSARSRHSLAIITHLCILCVTADPVLDRHCTGPGSELDDNLLSEVSVTGAAVIPGDDVPALKTTHSRNIDWRNPVNNGN